MAWETYEPTPRDVLITRVRIGELTPEEAEAAAEQGGFGPLATKPSPIDFDPTQIAYWSLPMAMAWVAWRSIQQVREHCAEYREDWLAWFPGSWNVPTDDGNAFKRIDGHELKSVRRPTVVRLGLTESYLTSTETLPPTCQMTVAKAEKQLLTALAAGHLHAVARDRTGNVTEIPQREWPYLRLFEEQECDVLKYDPLDATPAFTDVKLKRDDLQRLWQEFLVQTYMIEPMTRAGAAGYVPLCAALHWIMTEGGTASQKLEDSEAWVRSVRRLIPLISTGEIQIIGRPGSGGPPEVIAGEKFAGVLVSQPARDEISVLVGTDAWIGCNCYIDDQHWNGGFNDQLYLSHYGPASWTHLQVKKGDILREVKFEIKNDAQHLTYASGAPGRPTSMNLIRGEFDARHSRGERAKTITQEAEALADWLGKAHPGAVPVKAKTIKNQLASEFRIRNARK